MIFFPPKYFKYDFVRFKKKKGSANATQFQAITS